MKRATMFAALMVLLAFASRCSLLGGAAGNFSVCSAVSVVTTQQRAIESAGRWVKAHPLSAAQMTKIEQAYTTWSHAQKLASTALVAINDSGGNPSAISLQTYTEALAQIGVLAADFIAIYESFSPTSEPMMKQATLLKADAATACVITDADITAQLTVPAWADL